MLDLNYIGTRRRRSDDDDDDDRGKEMPVRVVESNAPAQVSGFSLLLLLLLPSFEFRVSRLIATLRFCLSVNWIVTIFRK